MIGWCPNFELNLADEAAVLAKNDWLFSLPFSLPHADQSFIIAEVLRAGAARHRSTLLIQKAIKPIEHLYERITRIIAFVQIPGSAVPMDYGRPDVTANGKRYCFAPEGRYYMMNEGNSYAGLG